MPYTCTTVTSAELEPIVAAYSALVDTEPLITCELFDALRLPSVAKVRYYVTDELNEGRFVVAIYAGVDLVSLALCQEIDTDTVTLSHWVLVDNRHEFLAISIAGAHYLRDALGYSTCVGLATGEMQTRLRAVPGMTPAADLLTLDLHAL